MSMNLSVYVGPYVVAYGTRKGNERELLECFEDELQEGRGEAGSGDGKLYAIPNVEFGRDVSWDKYDSDREPWAISASAVQLEIEKMKNLANTFIAAIESSGGTCEVLWGVVCGVF